jgi:hypothetical protein
VSQLIKGVGEIEASTDNKVVLFFLVSPFVELGKNKILCDAGGIMSGARRYCMSLPHHWIERSAMRISFFVLSIFVAMVGIGTRAQAQNYPWCADYAGFGASNCGFTTIQQCMAALSGNGGFCEQNTQYQPTAGASTPGLRQKSHPHS